MMKKVASVIVLLIMMSIGGAVCYYGITKLINTTMLLTQLPAGHK